MAPWRKGKRSESWASNSNLSVYIFSVLFACWLGFQVWARVGGQPSPPGLDAMVMAALGVAITNKSVEKREREKELAEKVEKLEEFASEAHPEMRGEKGDKGDRGDRGERGERGRRD